MSPLLMLLDEMQNLYDRYPLLVTIFLIIGGYKVKLWLQRDKSRLNQDEDEHSHKQKAQLYKTKLQITKLTNVYSTLFEKFQRTKKAISDLLARLLLEKISPAEEEAWNKQAKKSAKQKKDLQDFLMINLLFLSPKTRQYAQELYKKLDNLSFLCHQRKAFKNATLRDKEDLEEIESLIRELEQQMQQDLSEMLD